MKKTLLFAVSLLAINSCTQFDDSALRDDIDDLKTRMAALEAWQATVNGNIVALQGLVNALQNNRYITNVSEFATPAPGGYIITFSTGAPITIQHGTKGDKGDKGDVGDKGDDGSSPQIGVAENPIGSGVYYWTLNGVFIEINGQYLRVTGNNGQDGQPGATPGIAIGSDNYWYICPSGTCIGTPPGNGWQNTGVKATGNDGQDVNNGNDGQPGATPGIAIGSDNYWYICPGSTCTGTPPGGGWENTNVKAIGTNGTNGITPQLRINPTTNFWEVCYTGGTCADGDWQSLNVKATGADGKDGTSGSGDAIFSDVEEEDDYVIFTLTDNSEIRIPKHKAVTLSFNQPGVFKPKEVKIIDYTLTGNRPIFISTIVLQEGVLQDSWKVTVDTINQQIMVKAPEALTKSSKQCEAVIIACNDKDVAMHSLLLRAELPEGVRIGNLYWAVANVDDFGEFAAAPNYLGKYYQFNNKRAYTPEDLPAKEGYTPLKQDWDSQNDPCPEGWRMPTEEDMRSSFNIQDFYGTQSGRPVEATPDNWNVAGIWFGPGSATASAGSYPDVNAIFIPAAGCLYASQGGYPGNFLRSVGFALWSATYKDRSGFNSSYSEANIALSWTGGLYDNPYNYISLEAGATGVVHYMYNALSVRCVRDAEP
jgi:hypothetical protein